MDIRALEEIELLDANSDTQRLGDLWAERRIVLVFTRHFG